MTPVVRFHAEIFLLEFPLTFSSNLHDSCATIQLHHVVHQDTNLIVCLNVEQYRATWLEYYFCCVYMVVPIHIVREVNFKFVNAISVKAFLRSFQELFRACFIVRIEQGVVADSFFPDNAIMYFVKSTSFSWISSKMV